MKVLVSITLSVVAIAAVVGVSLIGGLPAVFLLLAAVTLAGVIALIWSSLARLPEDSEMTFEEALSLAAPTAEEEQKRAVLRALKDLEYELFLGKISREDYDKLSAEYREKARHFIAQADSSLGEKKNLAEERLANRMRELSEEKRPSKQGSKKKARKK